MSIPRLRFFYKIGVLGRCRPPTSWRQLLSGNLNNRSFKTEVINFLGPWKSVGQVEWETCKRVDWRNAGRLHSAIGYLTPQVAEEAFRDTLNADEKAARLLNQAISDKPGAVHVGHRWAAPAS
jgi:hypothetical protein